MERTNNKKGFTIIEVVLVLAIAGLIFLVVFLALPALQRGQRDSQRKSDLTRMMSQAVTFQSNRQGTLPTSAQWNDGASTGFKGGYLLNNNQKFVDPNSDPSTSYTITQQASLPGGSNVPTPPENNIYIYVNASCGGPNGVRSATGGRNFAGVIYQEQGGYFCADNR